MAIIQTKSERGVRIRATGKDAQRLFDALCSAHALDNPMKTAEPSATKPVDVPAQEATEKPDAS